MAVFPHKPQWQSLFTSVVKKIYDNEGIPIEPDHICSTAVKGLSAKDCVDALGGIDGSDSGLKLVGPIERFRLFIKVKMALMVVTTFLS